MVNKISELKCSVFEYNFDIIVINESWLNDSVPDNCILDNFHIFRKDRGNNIRGGGVLIGVKNIHKCSQKVFDSCFEDLIVEIFLTKFKILLITLYRPPNITINFKHYLENCFKNIDQNSYDLICFLGDLNIDFCINAMNSTSNEVKENFLFYGLEQLVKWPTHPVPNPKSILDLFFTNNKDIIENLEINENIAKSCDHFSLSFDISVLKPKNVIKTKTKIFFDSQSLSLINEELFSIDWFCITRNINCIEVIYDIMKNTFENIINKYKKIKLISLNNTKQFNTYIRSLIKLRKKLKKYESNSFGFIEKYEFLTFRIGLEIEKYESNKFNKLIKNSHNFSKFYRYLKLLTKQSNAISFIDNDGNNINNNELIVKNFKSIFESKFILSTDSEETNINPNYSDIVENIEISINDIIIVLKNFNCNKSEGITFVNNIIIKNCLNGISKLLYCLFNRIIELEKIPINMKKSIVSPVLKSNKNKQ